MKTSQKKKNLHDGLNFLNIEEKKNQQKNWAWGPLDPLPLPPHSTEGFLFLFYIDKRKAWET